jgi:hypothetical protein
MGESGGVNSNNTANTPPDRQNAVHGLGDAVHALTHSLGIRECGGCAKRREWLNRMWRWSQAPDPVSAYIIGQEENRT